MKIFLSHSNKDKQVVNTFKKFLHKSLEIWIDDENLVWGYDLEKTFSSAIKADVNFLVVFLSPNAVESAWVRREIE